MTTQTKAVLDSPQPVSSLEVYDMAGRQIAIPYSIHANEIILKRGNLKRGVYVVKIFGQK